METKVKTKVGIWVVVILALVAAGAFYQMQIGDEQAADIETEVKATKNSTVVLVKTDAEGQKYLTDKNGMTLYTFSNDQAGVSNCDAACLEKWPALTATADNIGADVKVEGDFTTIANNQVTYKGLPLYHYAEDAAVGDMKGDGVNKTWNIARP